MNFFSVPYENDYGMYADQKIKSAPQYPQMNMNPGLGQGQPMSVQPLNPPQMNLQMQMPSGMPPMSSYPMQSMPLNMMPGAGNGGMAPMSTMSTQLPIGAMAPLSSMTMMPMGNSMGSIDAPGINAVLPDLQPMSAMGQMQPMQQYDHTASSTQLHQGRMAGGAPSHQASHAGSWNSNPNQSHSSGGIWQYSQPMQHQSQQMQYNQHHQHQQHHQQHHQQQHNQAQQHQNQGNRMKSFYDLQPAGMHYRELRNGLNTPTTSESTKFSKVNNSFNCGKTSSKVPHWR